MQVIGKTPGLNALMQLGQLRMYHKIIKIRWELGKSLPGILNLNLKIASWDLPLHSKLPLILWSLNPVEEQTCHIRH